ncbi:MAG: copper resistance protein CopC [Acidobacteria bacterium]|nr:copper resistance protein CopC [Acidobacteriota bacterium]
MDEAVAAVQPALPIGVLLLLSAGSLVAGSGLPALWREIATRLTAIGIWDALGRSADPFAGIVVLPVALALAAPALVTAAAIFSVAAPLALVLLLATRSRAFRTLLVLTAVCQGALALGGWIAQDALSRLAEQALALMTASGDAEVLGIAAETNIAIGALARTARLLLAPALGMIVMAVALRSSGETEAPRWTLGATSEGCSAAGRVSQASEAPTAASGDLSRAGDWQPAGLPSTAAGQQPSPQPSPRSPYSSEPQPSSHHFRASAPGSTARGARTGLAVLGGLMLLFSACDGLRARPAFESSVPEPGATVTAAPSAIRVTFGAQIDPASAIYVTRLPSPDSTGESAYPITVTLRLSPDDPGRRTLEASTKRLTSGLYHVTWTALPAQSGVARHGSFSFGVGVPVPPDNGMTHSLQDRDSGARGRRRTAAGGILLIVIGAVLPRVLARGAQ